MVSKDNESIRNEVRKRYGAIAQNAGSSCCSGSSCCGAGPIDIKQITRQLGYTLEEMQKVPEGSNMGLGCGNPVAIASLKPGETVLDLGSGGGFDCFLAADKVGQGGLVIGVDMTPEMVDKARKNAAEGGFANVEFRLGEIENLPVADNSVDVIISNCVINLSTDKLRVFKEMYRVLKKGGRLAISDVVATVPLTGEFKEDLSLYTGCISGALFIEDLKRMLVEAGFANIKIAPKEASKELISEWAPGKNVEDFVVSADIEAVKL